MIFRITLPTWKIFLWFYLLMFLLYSVPFDAYRQGTVGKHLMKLRVICTSEVRPILMTSFYRNLAKAVSILILVDIYLLFMGKQGFHNRMVDCQVIGEDKITLTPDPEGRR